MIARIEVDVDMPEDAHTELWRAQRLGAECIVMVVTTEGAAEVSSGTITRVILGTDTQVM